MPILDHPVTLPDVANTSRPELGGRLAAVGMSDIELPVQIALAAGDQPTLTPARVDAFVDLDDPEAKGIHMSRLFLRLHETLPVAPVTPASLVALLDDFITSHADRSKRAEVTIRSEVMLLRDALLSGNRGYRSYPVTIQASYEPDIGTRAYVTVGITYSSTCPCSAALARQLIAQKFETDHHNIENVSVADMREWLLQAENICATPHSQRSVATITVGFEAGSTASDWRLLELIDGAEETLQTPVQAAVKRADEQEFALRNGRNLMFCEDASRRLQSWLRGHNWIADWALEARHLESLHPHDAVARAHAGVAGGLRNASGVS